MNLQIEKINNIIDINGPILTIQELLNKLNYEFNSLYIDKFWDNISDDHWIYINDDMLKWIGYNYSEMRICRQKFIKLINKNFKDIVDYKLINTNEFKKSDVYLQVYIEKNTNIQNKTKHMMVSPDCFKQILMLLRTEKSIKIKEYYIELEKIYKLYVLYQNKYKELENNKILNLLKEKENELKEKNEDLNRFKTVQANSVKLLEKNEFVYIATSFLNAINNIFKIGKTKAINSRLSNFNINSLKGNEFYYSKAVKCYDSAVLESLIHSFLKPFNYKNEMFQLHHDPLSKLVDKICTHYDIMTNMVNDYIKNEYKNDLGLDNVTPEPINHIEKKDVEDEETHADEYDINIYIAALENNIIEYKGLKLYLCPKCNDFMCKEKTTLLNHLNRVTPCMDGVKPNLTDDCINNLIDHNKINLYPCTKCNKIIFPTPYKLKRHLYSLTPCNQIFKCTKCNTEFRTENDRNSHSNRMYCLDSDGNKIQTSIDNIQDTANTTNDTNTNDTNTQDTKINNIPDVTTNEINSNINKLSEDINNTINSNSNTKHIPTINTDSKINIIGGLEFYNCNMCNTIFKTKQNLKSHQNRKIKCTDIYKCDKCGKICHSIENLRKHQNKKIPCDKNAYECEICKKQFISNGGLTKHKKIKTPCVNKNYTYQS